MRLQTEFFTRRSHLTTRILTMTFRIEGAANISNLLTIFQEKASPTRRVFGPVSWRLEHYNER